MFFVSLLFAQLITDIPVELFQKAEKSYSKEQTDFALTLHMYGPKAYSYLRDTMKVPLPHPRTLQRYLYIYIKVNKYYISAY